MGSINSVVSSINSAAADKRQVEAAEVPNFDFVLISTMTSLLLFASTVSVSGKLLVTSRFTKESFWHAHFIESQKSSFDEAFDQVNVSLGAADQPSDIYFFDLSENHLSTPSTRQRQLQLSKLFELLSICLFDRLFNYVKFNSRAFHFELPE